MGQWIDMDTLHGRIRAWRAGPAHAAVGVVLVQEIYGVNAHIREVAGRLGDAGFAVLAPALFDVIEPGIELDYDEAGTARGRMHKAAVGFDRAADMVGAARDVLQADATRVAAVGFCWGGTLALLANTRYGMPAVDYYGGGSVPFLHETPRAPLLMHFGRDDALIPPDDVQAHRDAYPDARLHVYPAGHGFNCDRRADFRPDSAALAWARTVDFLKELAP